MATDVQVPCLTLTLTLSRGRGRVGQNVDQVLRSHGSAPLHGFSLGSANASRQGQPVNGLAWLAVWSPLPVTAVVWWRRCG